MRPTDQSSYILANRLSTSALRFVAFLSSAVCFSWRCCVLCRWHSVNAARVYLHPAVLVATNTALLPEYRCTAHHIEYSAWNIGEGPVRFCCNGNSRRAFCSAYSYHRPSTSRNPHILQARKRFALFRLSVFYGDEQSAPAPVGTHPQR